MLCPEASADLGAWIDGELPAPQAVALAAHVQDCTACTAAADTFRGLRAQVRSLSEPAVVPPALLDRLVEDPGPAWWFTDRVVYALAGLMMLALVAMLASSRMATPHGQYGYPVWTESVLTASPTPNHGAVRILP